MTLKIFHSKPLQSLKRSLVSRASVSMKFNIISVHFSVSVLFLFPPAIMLTCVAFFLVYLYLSVIGGNLIVDHEKV